MVVSVSLVFFVISALVFVGFLANYFFDRIRIPDSLILILLGILLGPVLNHYAPENPVAQIFNPAAFESFSGVFASLAIMVIMFETGLMLDLKRVIEEAPRSFFFATAHYFFTSILSAAIAMLFFGWDWPFAFMVGFLLGGTSAAIVIPLAKRLGVSSEEQTLVELESTITNVYNVVFVLAIAQFILVANTDLRAPIQNILAAFSVSIVFGTLLALFWQEVLVKLRGHPFSYMLTFAVLMAGYAFMSEFGGNGPLFSLVFGAVMTNYRKIPVLRMVNMIQLHREISFFVRVFFFVFLGVVFKMSAEPLHWLFAGILVAISLVGRYIAGGLIGVPSKEKIAILIPRGLSEAVLAALLTQMFAGTEYVGIVQSIVQIVSITVIWSNILAAILVWYVLKYGVPGQSASVEAGAQPQG